MTRIVIKRTGKRLIERPGLGRVKAYYSPSEDVVVIRDTGRFPSSSIDPIVLAHELVHSRQAGTSGYGEDFIEDEIEATILSYVLQGKPYRRALIKQRDKLSENLGVDPLVFDEIRARVERELREKGFPFPMRKEGLKYV